MRLWMTSGLTRSFFVANGLVPLHQFFTALDANGHFHQLFVALGGQFVFITTRPHRKVRLIVGVCGIRVGTGMPILVVGGAFAPGRQSGSDKSHVCGFFTDWPLEGERNVVLDGTIRQIGVIGHKRGCNGH